jgi:ABC-2 type transport system permease protein
VGEVLAIAGFASGRAAVPHAGLHATLGQPGVLRAVLMGGAYPALIALVGLGLAALIRHTAGAISAIVGVVFVLPLILLPLGQQNAAMKFLPEMIAENSLTAVKPVANSLSAGAGLAMLCLYAAVALAAGGWALARRDA